MKFLRPSLPLLLWLFASFQLSLGQQATRHLRRQLLGICQGDCETNADCDAGLVCFQRNIGLPVPSCDNIASPRHDICIPQWLHPRPEIESLPSIRTSTARPLPECGGDCNTDADCSGNLICYQRNRGGDPIPGCRGFDASQTDYCVKPTASTKSPVPSTFTNQYSREYVFEITMTYPSNTVNRAPTTQEYDGLAAAILNYIDRRADASYAAAQSFKYIGSEIVTVTQKSQFKWVARMKANFRANSIMAVPNAYWFSQMIRNDITGAILLAIQNVSPTTSIFRRTSTALRAINPYLGETAAPARVRRNGDLFD